MAVVAPFSSSIKMLKAWSTILFVALFALPSAAEDAIQLEMVTFDLPPYAYVNNGEAKGLSVIYVENLMKRAQIDYNIKLLPAKRALLYTAATPNTCVFPVERSQEREVKYSWISPVSVSRHGLYSDPARPVGKITVLDDIKDLRIGSYLGSAVGEYLASFGFNVDFAADNHANVIKLQADRIDLWASDTRSAKYLAQEAGFAINEPELVFFTTLGAIGCNLQVPQEIIEHLRKNLYAMYKDGSIANLRDEFIR